jgi:hypothetical protein
MSDEINPGYAAGQLARALITSESHQDEEVRARAAERVAKWHGVLVGMFGGALQIGSRTPVNAPAWATLEVLKGGFATGNLLAGGALRADEVALAGRLGLPATSRAQLNAFFLSETGLAELTAMLESGCYRIEIPEQGALLVMAWLLRRGETERAHSLVDEILPYFDQLQFYPVPNARPLVPSAVVRLKTLGEVAGDLKRVKTPVQVQRMNEALSVWAPLGDKLVALFRETLVDGVPCRKFAGDWRERARAFLAEYKQLRTQHPLCTKVDKPRENFARLRAALERVVDGNLQAREVGAVPAILAAVERKRGGDKLAPLRTRQAADAARPTSPSLAQKMLDQLHGRPLDQGLPSVEDIAGDYPAHLVKKLLRCLEAPIEDLVDRGVITSSEVIARVLPQITSQVAAAGIVDAQLRVLQGAVYAAFRRRRSLLLLNLARQVQLNELPWVAVSEPFRKSSSDERTRAKETLEQLVLLTLSSFPYVILPNKLLQEVKALCKTAGLKLPIVEEVAADIFLGTFTEKYLRAAQIAARFLGAGIYQRYYDVPWERVLRDDRIDKDWGALGFANLCIERVEPSSRRSVAYNGTILEQEQILTTHNLAVLFDALTLQTQPLEMAKDCFVWVCRQQQLRREERNARLQMMKNTAYAWRQMIFFLSIAGDVRPFREFAEAHFAKQRADFRQRFAPAWQGLIHILDGASFDEDGFAPNGGRRFLGWTTEQHWLL